VDQDARGYLKVVRMSLLPDTQFFW
jgi:hypothetical protein